MLGTKKFKYKRVKIIWQDIVSSSDWTTLDKAKEQTYSWCEDTGYLLHKDPKKVIIFASHSFCVLFYSSRRGVLACARAPACAHSYTLVSHMSRLSALHSLVINVANDMREHTHKNLATYLQKRRVPYAPVPSASDSFALCPCCVLPKSAGEALGSHATSVLVHAIF